MAGTIAGAIIATIALATGLWMDSLRRRDAKRRHLIRHPSKTALVPVWSVDDDDEWGDFEL